MDSRQLDTFIAVTVVLCAVSATHAIGPGGACCFFDGSCMDVPSEIECAILEADWQGEGTSCATITCPQPQACCRVDGTCVEVLALTCQQIGGAPQGDGTLCATTTCPLTGAVLDKDKISDTAGGFLGVLDDFDRFGWSAANLGDLDGDGVTDIAVGCDGDDDGGSNRGAVWIVFLNADGAAKSEQKISDTAGGFTGILDDFDSFGYALASVGDLDGDGIVDLAVGAPFDDDDGFNRGAVWILFLDTDGTVKSHQKISDTAGGFTGVLDNFDRLGASVGSIGDLDGDGIGDLAVGAINDDDGGSDRGAVWIMFLNANGTVSSHQKISDTQGGFTGVLSNFDAFGSAVASVGDLDGNGVVEIAVGAHDDDDGGTNRGAVWVLFLNTNGTVANERKLSDTSGGFGGVLDDGDEFGMSLAGLGDLDGDGLGDIAVGAPGDDDSANPGELTGVGSVWILLLDAAGFVREEVKISDTQGGLGGVLDTNDRFGRSIAFLGDLDGDGRKDLAVGADQDDDGGPNRGAMWLLYLDGPVTGFGFDPPQQFAASGVPIRHDVGDLDADGDLDVIVVIPDDDPGQAGVIEVFINQGVDVFGDWLGLVANPTVPAGLDPSDVTIGHINDDPFYDAAVTNRGANTAWVYINDGSGMGTFLPPIVVPVGTAPSAIVAADFVPTVGPGAPLDDLAIGEEGDDTVAILGNDGMGGFTEVETIASNDPKSMEPEDLDDDKDTDLLIGRGDSNVDVWQNDLDPGSGVTTLPVGSPPADVTIADLEHDGDADLISANMGGTLSVILNNGGTVFDSAFEVSIGDYPMAVDVGDLDGDTDYDVAVAADVPGIGPAVQVIENLYGLDGVSFGVPLSFQVGADPRYLVTADLDADGLKDIVLVGSTDVGASGTVTVLINHPPGVECPGDIGGDGTVGFQDLLALLAAWSPDPQSCTFCPEDLDGDGDVDFQDLLILLGAWGGCP